MSEAPGRISNSRRASVLAAALAALSLNAAPVDAYPIDCAILLCLAGGFPASVECTAAKAEMIRRVTPWPIEPPLQLWRCPMGSSPAGASGAGTHAPPPEVARYRDSIELYHINYSQMHKAGELRVTDRSRVGAYDDAGDLFWSQIRMRDAPGWLFKATGGNEQAVKGRAGTIFRWRGVLLRWRDYQGNYTQEWIHY